MARILIVDDHPLYREGVISALGTHPLRANVVGLSSGSAALSLLGDDPTVELVMIDRRLQNEDGLATLRLVGQRHPGVTRALISADETPELVSAAQEAGAQGFLPKSLSIAQLLAAVQRLLAGETYWPHRPDEPPVGGTPSRLTLRQLEVLRLLSEGQSNADMAITLGVAERTVKAHMSALFAALDVDSRTRALVRARQLGLIP